MKTKTATPKSSGKHSDLDNTSRAAQQRRLLQRLSLGPVDTLTARIELNIMHPGGRVLELRALPWVMRFTPSALRSSMNEVEPTGA